MKALMKKSLSLSERMETEDLSVGYEHALYNVVLRLESLEDSRELDNFKQELLDLIETCFSEAMQ